MANRPAIPADSQSGKINSAERCSDEGEANDAHRYSVSDSYDLHRRIDRLHRSFYGHLPAGLRAGPHNGADSAVRDMHGERRSRRLLDTAAITRAHDRSARKWSRA